MINASRIKKTVIVHPDGAILFKAPILIKKPTKGGSPPRLNKDIIIRSPLPEDRAIMWLREKIFNLLNKTTTLSTRRQ